MRPVLLAIALAACSFPKPADVGPGDAAPDDGRGGSDGTGTDDAQPSRPALMSFAFLKSVNPGLPHDLIATLHPNTVEAYIYGPAGKLTPTFALTPGATAEVNGLAQVSGITAQDFDSPVVYDVRNADSQMGSAYTVRVHVRRLDARAGIALLSATAIAVGDLDGDGKPDLVVGLGGNSLAIYRNVTAAPGSPAFSTSPVPLTTVGPPSSIAIVDLDGDLKPEIVVGNSGTVKVEVFRNMSTPGLLSFATTSSKIDFGMTPVSVVAGDFDGSGGLDLAGAADGTVQEVAVRLNTTPQGSGASTITFGPATLVAITDPVGLAVADVNINGKTDLLVASGTDSSVTVIDNGTPTAATMFTGTTTAPLAVGLAPRGFAIADFDADGRPDALVATTGAMSFTVLHNSSAGYSAAPQATLGNCAAISAYDLDNDGVPDPIAVGSILTTTTPTSALEPFITGPSMTFVGQPSIPGGPATPIGSASADLDGDGLTDLVVVYDGSYALFMLTDN